MKNISQIQSAVKSQFSELDRKLDERLTQFQASVESLITQAVTQFQASVETVYMQATQPTQIQVSTESSITQTTQFQAQPRKSSDFSLHSLRKKKKISQSQLALSLGVSRNRVANWESGRSQIPDDVLKKLS